MIKKLIWFLSKKNIPKDKKTNKQLSWKNQPLVKKHRQDNKDGVRDILSDSWTKKKVEITMSTQKNRINMLTEERRANVRMSVESILLNPNDKNVESKSNINGRFSRDELSNISLWWLQLVSRDKTKKIWDIINFKFRLGIHNFSLKWEVSNIVDAHNEKKTVYWIKFIDVPKEQQKAISEILGSIKLTKTFY